MRAADDPEVVYFESSTSADSCVEDEVEVSRRDTMFDSIRGAALSPGQSASLIASMADSLSDAGSDPP